MNTKGALAIAAVTFGLSACTTLGTNVSGKFRCEAADGICAPSLVIDDSAIARIEETTSADLLNPAGPFRMDDGISAPVRGQSLGFEALVARSSPSYELSVVFPGYTDAAGTAHGCLLRASYQYGAQAAGRLEGRRLSYPLGHVLCHLNILAEPS